MILVLLIAAVILPLSLSDPIVSSGRGLSNRWKKSYETHKGCGKIPIKPGQDIEGTITGGVQVTQEEPFPWMVSIAIYDLINGKVKYCGGSMVTNGKVLTAAHCVMDAVAIGDIRLGGMVALSLPVAPTAADASLQLVYVSQPVSSAADLEYVSESETARSADLFNSTSNVGDTLDTLGAKSHIAIDIIGVNTRTAHWVPGGRSLALRLRKKQKRVQESPP